MKSAIVAVVGIILGGLAALGYGHYLGEGKQLADLQAQLAQDKTALDKSVTETKAVKSENDALTTQVDQLATKRDDLQKQLDVAKSGAPAPAAAKPANPFANFGGMVKTVMARQREAKFLALKARLHLSADQEAAIQDVMDQEAKQSDELAKKMMAGEKFNPADLKGQTFVSLEGKLNDILTPEQKTEYTKMQTEEKNSAAESMASVEMNQFAPALNLSDTQKDQVYSALAQVHLDSQDPKWIANNAVKGGDPMAMLQAQAKAKEDALSKILTPDQLATYRQQAQSQLDMQKEMFQKFMPSSNSPGVSAPVVRAPDNP